MDPLRRKTLLGLTSAAGLTLAGGLLGPDGLPLARSASANPDAKDNRDRNRDTKDRATELALAYLPLLVLSQARFRINSIMLVSLFGLFWLSMAAGVIARSQNRLSLPLFGSLQRAVYSPADVALVRAVGIILLLNTTMFVLLNPFTRPRDYRRLVALNQDQDFEFNETMREANGDYPAELAGDIEAASRIPLVGRYIANKAIPGDSQIVTELAQGARQTSIGVPGLDDIPAIRELMFGQAVPYDHSTLLLHVTPTLARDSDES